MDVSDVYQILDPPGTWPLLIVTALLAVLIKQVHLRFTLRKTENCHLRLRRCSIPQTTSITVLFPFRRLPSVFINTIQPPY